MLNTVYICSYNTFIFFLSRISFTNASGIFCTKTFCIMLFVERLIIVRSLFNRKALSFIHVLIQALIVDLAYITDYEGINRLALQIGTLVASSTYCMVTAGNFHALAIVG